MEGGNDSYCVHVFQVIGAGRGVGREVAIQLSQSGVSVACVDINPENCEVTAQRASQLLGVARPFICDITDQNKVRMLTFT